MDALLQALEQHGCDVQGGLRRFVGSEALYVKYLHGFPTEPMLAQFQAALCRGAYERAQDEIHTYKGVAGNLGLTELYTLAQTILELLRAERYGAAAVCGETLADAHARLAALISSTPSAADCTI